MKSITVLAFGISVVVALFGLLPVVAIIKNGDLGILQNSSPGVEVTVSSGAPPAATSVPTPSPSPTLVPTSTPSPTVGIEFKEGHSYAIEDPGCVVDCGIPIRAAPTSESRQVGTLQLGQEVEILGVIDGQMWLNWGQNIVAKDAFPSWTNKWYQLEKGYIYSAFIFIPMPGELSPIVSGEKWVEVDRANQILHAYVDGREVFQAPIGVGLSWTPTPLGEGYKVLDRIFNETMSGEGYHVQNVLFTMYFTGDISIHLDWWHDDSYFGNEPTSHGCVGLQLHNAQWIWLFGFEEMRVRIYE